MVAVSNSIGRVFALGVKSYKFKSYDAEFYWNYKKVLKWSTRGDCKSLG